MHNIADLAIPALVLGALSQSEYGTSQFLCWFGHYGHWYLFIQSIWNSSWSQKLIISLHSVKRPALGVLPGIYIITSTISRDNYGKFFRLEHIRCGLSLFCFLLLSTCWNIIQFLDMCAISFEQLLFPRWRRCGTIWYLRVTLHYECDGLIICGHANVFSCLL